LDRRLIPRGDHRLQGSYDPHACPQKLIFNARELPLSAAFLDRPGCVPAYRHTRFAPLWVPERVLNEGLSAARGNEPLGQDVPNLTAKALRFAEANGGPAKLFAAIARFVESAPVQDIWAPAFGTARELPVPLSHALFDTV
jgi:hypothetical protein